MLSYLYDCASIYETTSQIRISYASLLSCNAVPFHFFIKPRKFVSRLIFRESVCRKCPGSGLIKLQGRDWCRARYR